MTCLLRLFTSLGMLLFSSYVLAATLASKWSDGDYAVSRGVVFVLGLVGVAY